jgi:N-acetylglucosamine kinase-like BadF-type ATPase
MILIADSGSTKTDWKGSDGFGKVVTARTGGINPYYLPAEDIIKEIKEARQQLASADFEAIYFYGAGCSTPEKKDRILEGLSMVFPYSEMEVNGDLLGAARALCQTEPGIACIIGTGSGSCVYDGVRISKSIPSLGFILGDEGSGAFMGKKLVRDYLREEMPREMIQTISRDLGISKDIILENVNWKPMPSRYLGGFAKFIHDHLDNDYIMDLVSGSLKKFVDHYVIRYKEAHQYRIHFTGSIAMNFMKVLRNVLMEKNLKLGNVEDSPIQGMIEYHLNTKI